MSEEIKDLTKRVDSIEIKLDNIIKILVQEGAVRKNNATIIDNNFALLDGKLTDVKKSVNALQDKVGVLHDDTDKGFDKIRIELVKIQKSTGYDGMYENFKIIEGGKKK